MLLWSLSEPLILSPYTLRSLCSEWWLGIPGDISATPLNICLAHNSSSHLFLPPFKSLSLDGSPVNKGYSRGGWYRWNQHRYFI